MLWAEALSKDIRELSNYYKISYQLRRQKFRYKTTKIETTLNKCLHFFITLACTFSTVNFLKNNVQISK